MSTVHCRFSVYADADLEEIFNTIMDDGKPRRAASFVMEIRDRCQTAAYFPLSGVAVPHIYETWRKIVFRKTYIIYYEPLDDVQGIYVTRIMSSNMNQRQASAPYHSPHRRR